MSHTRPTVSIAVVTFVAACASTTPPTTITTAPGAEGVQPQAVEAGASFMREMLVHHAQALEMAALVEGRAHTNAIRALATKIRLSQTDEMGQMERWLEERRERLSGASHAHHSQQTDGSHDRQQAGEHTRGHFPQHAMPGMASLVEMQRLSAAGGLEFDRLFLELMIRHHEGALVMVDQLFATPAAAADSELYRIAAEIDSEQRIEIARMRAVLATLQQR